MLRRNLLTRCHINSTFIWVQHFECISPSHLQELNDVTYAISGEFAKWYCLSYSLLWKVWKCFIACHKNLNNGSQIFMACTIGQYTDKINAKLQTYAGWQKKVRSSPQLFLPLFPPCVCGKALFSLQVFCGVHARNITLQSGNMSYSLPKSLKMFYRVP